MENFGRALLYIMFAVMQVYILCLCGIKARVKKIMGNFGNAQVSSLINNFLIPIYGLVEISKLTSMENLKKYWALLILTIVSLVLRLTISFSYVKLANLNIRTYLAYVLILTLPALGPYTLVISKSMCYEGQPLHDDPLCSNILGIMMLIFLIFSIFLFSVGHIIMNTNSILSNDINDKLKHILYPFLNSTKSNHIDLEYLFEKYVVNEDDRKEAFNSFISKYSLVCDKNYAYKCLQKNKVQEKVSESKDLKKTNLYLSAYVDKHCINDVFIGKEVSNHKCLNKNIKSAIKNINNEIDINKVDINYPIEIVEKTENSKDDFQNSILHDNQVNEKENDSIYKYKVKPISQNDLNVIIADSLKFDNKNFNVKETIKKDFQDLSEKIILGNKNYKITNIENIKSTKRSLSYSKLKSKNAIRLDIFDSNADNQNIIESNKKEILLYYNYLFNHIHKYIERLRVDNVDNKVANELEKEFHIEKMLYLSNVKDKEIPEFKIIDSINISNKDLKVLNSIWKDYSENFILKNNLKLQTQKTEALNLKGVAGKLFNPPIIGCIIGLMIGLSGLREILHNVDNHYINSIYQVIILSEIPFVPFLFVNMGFLLSNLKPLNKSFSLTKIQIYITFAFMFFIFPGIGLLFVYICKNLAEANNIINTSIVFKFAIYLPWSIPSSPVIMLLCSANKGFYINEFNILVSWQIILSLLFQTFSLIIFFLAFT